MEFHRFYEKFNEKKKKKKLTVIIKIKHEPSSIINYLTLLPYLVFKILDTF